MDWASSMLFHHSPCQNLHWRNFTQAVRHLAWATDQQKQHNKHPESSSWEIEKVGSYFSQNGQNLYVLRNHPFNISWQFLTLIELHQELRISFSLSIIKGSWLSLLEITVLSSYQQFKTDMILQSLVLEHELPNCLQMCHMDVMLRQRWHQNAQMLCPVLSLVPF